MRQEIEQTPREQETAEQAKLQKYFEDYDRINRPKTLLEEHQEKNKEKKEGSGRTAFDRESYGGYSRIESKNVFQMVSNASSGLSQKFSSGKFKGSFM